MEWDIPFSADWVSMKHTIFSWSCDVNRWFAHVEGAATIHWQFDHGVEPREMGRKFTWVTLRYLTLDILGNPFIYTLFCLLLTGVILALCILEDQILFVLRCFTLVLPASLFSN